MSKPEVKVFTKASPCTKLELWQCFRVAKGFQAVQESVAHSIIGENAPRYLIREGYATRQELKGVDYLRLTPEGEGWLLGKFKSYLRNHPEHVADAPHVPKDWGLAGASKAVDTPTIAARSGRRVRGRVK